MVSGKVPKIWEEIVTLLATSTKMAEEYFYRNGETPNLPYVWMSGQRRPGTSLCYPCVFLWWDKLYSRNGVSENKNENH